jgi:hypothetical protein
VVCCWGVKSPSINYLYKLVSLNTYKTKKKLIIMGKNNDAAFGFISVEWDNNGKLVALEMAIGLLALLMLGYLHAVFVNTGDLGLASTVTFLQLLIVFSGIIFVGEKGWEKISGKDIFETVGFGESFIKAGLAVLFGAIFAFVLNLGSFSIAIIGAQSFLSTGGMNLLFIVFFAGTIEELFFRGSLLPTINKVAKTFGLPFHGEIALVLQALAFGLFHFGVIVAVNPNALITDPRIIVSVVFGLIVGIGNGVFASTGFGYSAHLTNNYFALMSMGGF